MNSFLNTQVTVPTVRWHPSNTGGQAVKCCHVLPSISLPSDYFKWWTSTTWYIFLGSSPQVNYMNNKVSIFFIWQLILVSTKLHLKCWYRGCWNPFIRVVEEPARRRISLGDEIWAFPKNRGVLASCEMGHIWGTAAPRQWSLPGLPGLSFPILRGKTSDWT